jgi:hypothetical protein
MKRDPNRTRSKGLNKAQILDKLEGRLATFPGSAGFFNLVVNGRLQPSDIDLADINEHTLALMLDHYSREGP